MSAPVPVVGIGADGLPGLAPRSRQVLERASAIHGSPRQLDLVADLGRPLRPWPSPLVPALPELFEEIARDGGAILASGDPMFHGIGATLARVVGAHRLRVYPAPSSVSLAAARLGWPLADLTVHSCVTADPHVVLSTARPGHRALVLCRDSSTPVELAHVLDTAGLGASGLTVLADLGADAETRHELIAAELAGAAGGPARWSDLCLVAVTYRVTPGAAAVLGGPAPGLPDSAFEHDGQLTKRVVRAVTVAALVPGGRLVAAAVTLESERVLLDWRARHAGELVRLGVETAEPLGGFTGWRPARPVVHLECVKPATEHEEPRP